MIVALWALVLARTSTPVQDAGPFPRVEDIQPSPEYLSWGGFGFLKPGPRKMPEGPPFFAAPGDWTGVEAAATRAPDPNAIPWPAKFFILKRVDSMGYLAGGALFEEQCSLETPDMDRIRRSIQQFSALVNAETNGKIRLVPDISVETDPVLLGTNWAGKIDQYVSPRFNGGAYQADDRVFRGPFASVFCIDATPSADRSSETRIMNETPITFLSGAGAGYQTDGELAANLASIWVEHVRAWAQGSGLQGPLAGVPQVDPVTGEPSPLPWAPNGDWRSVLAGEDLDAADIDSRLRLPVESQVASAGSLADRKLFRRSYKGASTDISIQTDPERGSILTYSERGTARNGGVFFPAPAGGGHMISVGDTPTLSFWARSASRDALGLMLLDASGHGAMVGLGRDAPGPSLKYQADFERDGQWRQVRVDLKKIGLANVDSMALMPTMNSRGHVKITLGPVEYSFADFKVGTEPAGDELKPIVPDPDSTDAWARALWAHQQTVPSPKLAGLLKDPQWVVRLNALHVYIAKPDPTAEALLTENATLAIDGPVSAAALDALWALGSDSAKAVVVQVLRTGVTEQGKAEAANLVTQSKDPSAAEKLIGLNQSRTLETRLAAVRALGRLPGDGPAEIRMSFLLQADPELKLEVTRTLDPDQASQQRELKVSAVDEPSDAVRAESDWALISSKDPAVRAEGYKGIKDDSLGVRLLLLRRFAEHPSESHRNAIRIAVTDRSARVRAAAVRAFAQLSKDVSWDEIGVAAEDRHPIVQLALIDLIKKKNLKPSDQMVSQMKTSADPRVRTAAKDLG